MNETVMGPHLIWGKCPWKWQKCNLHKNQWQMNYTLSEAWSGVNWADLMAAQGAFGTDFYDRSILRPKHRAYNRSGRPVIKIGPKGALGSHMRSA